MGIAITLKEYLANAGADYELIQHPRTTSTLQSSEVAHVPGDQMIKTVLLEDDENYLLVLLPATHRLDVDTLSELLKRKLKLTTEEEVTTAFADCETGSIPPFGKVYGIETWMDDSLMDQPELFFESGDHSILIRMESLKFKDLLGNAPHTNLSHHL